MRFSLQRDMMYGELPFFNARALDIPYTKELSLLIILPNKKDGLANLESKIKNFQLLSTLKNKLEMSSVDLSIPSFSTFYETKTLVTTLKAVTIGLFIYFLNGTHFSEKYSEATAIFPK